MKILKLHLVRLLMMGLLSHCAVHVPNFFGVANLNPPFISTISPTFGSAGGANLVTITGRNFVSGDRVTIGGAECTSVTVLSSNSLRCKTGAAASGIADVVVTAPEGLSKTYSSGFTLYSDYWERISSSSAPNSLNVGGYSVVWTGSKAIVWGGQGASYVNTGRIYDPDTDTWTATNTSGAPTGRYEHSAIWTGTEMIIWGGENGTGSLNSGARYNPTTDTWTALPASGLAVRKLHAAIWTGTEMVIWGGDTSAYGTGLDSGAKYNPTTNTWTALPGTGMTRVMQTAIWTGTHLILFGGQFSGNEQADGLIYNPTTNLFLGSISYGNANAFNHSAVWTGTEMIVYGGQDNGDFIQNVGYRYNVAGNNWLNTNTASAPTPRYQHVSAWTGSEMLVWGGWNGSGVSNGKKYRPTTDSWTVMSNTNAPDATLPAWGVTDYYMASVWTGTKFLIINASIPTASAAFYTP